MARRQRPDVSHGTPLPYDPIVTSVLDLFRLDGHVAVVTGGGTGIGRAMALGLAEAGADVVIAGRRPEPLRAVAAEIEARGRRALAVSTDVTISSELEKHNEC